MRNGEDEKYVLKGSVKGGYDVGNPVLEERTYQGISPVPQTAILYLEVVVSRSGAATTHEKDALKHLGFSRGLPHTGEGRHANTLLWTEYVFKEGK